VTGIGLRRSDVVPSVRPLRNGDRLICQVDVEPCQAAQFARPQASEHGDAQQNAKARILGRQAVGRVQNGAQVLLGRNDDPLAIARADLDLNRGGHVLSDLPRLHGDIEDHGQRPDRLARHGRRSRLEQRVAKADNIGRS